MRRLSRFNDFSGVLDKYDEKGNYVSSTPFKFNILQARQETIDPMTGTPMRKGDYLLKTEDPIEPVTRRDKVRVEWRKKPYIVGNQIPRPREGDNSGRRGQFKAVREFYIE
jgi:hypothetical protein